MYLPGTLLETEDHFRVNDSAQQLADIVIITRPDSPSRTLAAMRQCATDRGAPELCQEYWHDNGHIIGAVFTGPNRHEVEFVRLDMTAAFPSHLAVTIA